MPPALSSIVLLAHHEENIGGIFCQSADFIYFSLISEKFA
jgi:hypothetical protein